MGTVVTVCMFLGVLMAARLPILQGLPPVVSKFIGLLVLAGGLWNFFWYGLQHITEFWGFAALVSGALMIITAFYILAPSKLPTMLQKIRPLVIVVLLGYGVMYAVTIARL